MPGGQARKKSAQQQLLLTRSASKVPLIGRDRLAILRANGTMPHVNGSISTSSSLGQKARVVPAAHVSVEISPDENPHVASA